MITSGNLVRSSAISRIACPGLIALAALLPLCGCGGGGSVSSTPGNPAPTRPALPRLVGYLPDYDESYDTYATTLDYSHMTHLILAFGHAPLCTGTCTASSDMTISLQQTDAAIDTLVAAAHKAGVKVLISLGGGDIPGDTSIDQFYNAGLSAQLADSVHRFVTAHNMDGVDVDIEDPNNMGQPYADFVSALAGVLHPQGKILTAAMAPYLKMAIPDAVLSTCDFINVETYSTDSQAVSDLDFYKQTKSVPATKLVLGVPFYGQSADQSVVASYAAILAAYPNAWQADQVSGGSLLGGITLYYVGASTMAEETKLGAKYGGIMIWDLTQDAAAPHSLLSVIQTNL